MKTVLIIDDDIDTMDMISFALEEYGYSVLKISKEISIKEIEGLNPNLAIIDFLLPFGLGNELCLDMKSNDRTKHIPVILYSANAAIRKVSGTCNADSFMDKPFDLDELMKEVERLIN